LKNAEETQTQGRDVCTGALKHSKESLNAVEISLSPSGDSETKEAMNKRFKAFRKAKKQLPSGKSRSELEKVP
jgi:hypothetical protein